MTSLDPALVRGADPDAVYAAFVEWAESTGIRLYPAQDEALIEIVSGQNLILSTPTGTGKSLVAIGAHFAALADGRRTYYTAPIKALVSEKFFALVDVFGAANVGMITGDSSVNADAPIICCTAEILANLALRQGASAEVGQVVMDEFHFYGDPDRGWAWQVPLLELPQAQFVLMSATLGDVTELASDLTRRTARETAVVTGVERPVPLHFYYETTPIHETIDDLLSTGQAPIYIVHFSQAAAMERAQALASAKVATREQRDAIAELIGGFRFTTSFGKTLARLLRLGIGVHHAGMLPKYRRLVEQLAQRGMLRVICGTDTLGVGINVPIRTVLLTALTKFDGTRMRQLNAREFHQIAGRAGRAGYDTAGTVVAQAPEHESENLAAIRKAGDDPKKKRKIIRKKAPDGFVSWGEPSFQKLIAAEPETLTSHMQITSAMMLNVIARGGDVFDNMRALTYDNHEPRAKQRMLALRALGIYRTLRESGVVEQVPAGTASPERDPAPERGPAQPDRDEGPPSQAPTPEQGPTHPAPERGPAQPDRDEGPAHPSIRLTVDLQPNFALNQPLSPFALAAFDLLEPTDPGFALDMISIVESTLDDPRAILSQQEFVARGEAVAAMKREGIEYDERMELLEQITYPKPLEELLAAAFETYSAAQPWIRDFELHPKSVVRDMYERAMSFGEYVAFYKVPRSEGVVLRYLSDAYRAASQTIPEHLKTEELRDLIEWLGELVRQVDSSLLDEWALHLDPAGSGLLSERQPPASRLLSERSETKDPQGTVAPPTSGLLSERQPPASRLLSERSETKDGHEPILPPTPKRLTTNTRAFRILVRNELFRRVLLAARDDVDGLAALDPDFDGWPEALDGYYAEHDEILTGADARGPAMLILEETGPLWTARQILADPEGNHDWGISASIDLAASDEAGEAVVQVLTVTRL